MKTMRIQFDEELHRKLSIYAATQAMPKHRVVLEAVKSKVSDAENNPPQAIRFLTLKGRMKGVKIIDRDIQKIRRMWNR